MPLQKARCLFFIAHLLDRPPSTATKKMAETEVAQAECCHASKGTSPWRGFFTKGLSAIHLDGTLKSIQLGQPPEICQTPKLQALENSQVDGWMGCFKVDGWMMVSSPQPDGGQSG